MKIHFFGATRTTTGSMYLFEVNGRKLLLECGLFQGHREEETSRNCCFPFDPKQIDVAVLSHAHMDHAGNFPNPASKVFREIFIAPLPPGAWPTSCPWIPRKSKWPTPPSFH